MVSCGYPEHTSYRGILISDLYLQDNHISNWEGNLYFKPFTVLGRNNMFPICV